MRIDASVMEKYVNDWQQTVPDFFPSRFFISYSSFDSGLAIDIERILCQAGHTVWRDRTSLVVGDNWKTEVEFGIKNSDEIIVLLTPESSKSEPVAHEIKCAIKNSKRVNLFATFDPRTMPDVFALVSDINYVTVPSSELTAAAIGRHVLGSTVNAHPVGIREFEWLASRRVFPPFGDLLSEGRINRELANRYLGYRTAFDQHPGKANGVVWLNLALCATLVGEQRSATAYVETAANLSPHPVMHYFQACLLLQRTRPRHVAPALLDRCVAIATGALHARRSPLIALLLCALLADGQRASGAALAQLCADALDAIESVERRGTEILRLLFLLPMSEDMTMPLPTNFVLQKLKRALGD
jgi:hypothetical protein